MLSKYCQLLEVMVQDDSGVITPAVMEQALSLAVARYSTDKPLTKVEDVSSAGGRFVDLPGSWETSFSRLVSLESPVNEYSPHPWLSKDIKLYQQPDKWRLLLARALDSGQDIRLSYTVQHALTEDATTIPAVDMEAVVNWAASILLDQLANRHTGDRLPTIQSDSVDHSGRGSAYAARAEACRKLYWDHIGIDPKRTVAAGGVTTMPSKRRR